jgi:hypothetical protein
VPLELIGRDTGYDIWNVVQLERFTDDLRIGTQVVLPERVSQNHNGVRLPFESRSTRRPHADRLEVVGGDVHWPQGHLQSSRKLDLAWRGDPREDRNPGIRVAQVHEVRIGPRVGRRSRPTGRRDNFDQSVRVHAGRGCAWYSGEVRNRDDRHHPDAERHDTHECEPASLCQRAGGINQIAPGILKHAYH